MQMFIKKFICSTILFFSLVSFGQSANDKVVYLDSLGKDSNSIDYYSKNIIKDFQLEKTAYLVEKYSKKDNKVILIAKYYVSDKNKLILNGEFKTFYKSGKLKEIYYYKNDTLFGNTKHYYENGKLLSEGYYKEINGIPKYLLKNYWNKKGIQKVKNGNGTYEFYLNEDKKVLFSGNIKDEKFEGLWKCDNKSFPKYEKFYENGELIKGKIIKSDSILREYVGESTQANPEGGINNFRAKIANRINTSQFDVDLVCRVKVKFVVDTDGSVVDVNIIESDYPAINNTVYKAFKNLPKWESGIYNGFEVKQYYTMPISIQLYKRTQ